VKKSKGYLIIHKFRVGKKLIVKNRKLIIVPIFHASEEVLTKLMLYRKSRSKPKLQEMPKWEDLTRSFWRSVRLRLLETIESENPKKIKVYQDSADAIWTKNFLRTASKFSENYAILLELAEMGATLLKTESRKLLDRTGSLIKSLNITENEEEIDKLFLNLRRLSKKRDKWISKNIDKTLAKDELGILFIGVAHEVEKHLPKDIQVKKIECEEVKNFLQLREILSQCSEVE